MWNVEYVFIIYIKSVASRIWMVTWNYIYIMDKFIEWREWAPVACVYEQMISRVSWCKLCCTSLVYHIKMEWDNLHNLSHLHNDVKMYMTSLWVPLDACDGRICFCNSDSPHTLSLLDPDLPYRNHRGLHLEVRKM